MDDQVRPAVIKESVNRVTVEKIDDMEVHRSVRWHAVRRLQVDGAMDLPATVREALDQKAPGKAGCSGDKHRSPHDLLPSVEDCTRPVPRNSLIAGLLAAIPEHV